MISPSDDSDEREGAMVIVDDGGIYSGVSIILVSLVDEVFAVGL